MPVTLEAIQKAAELKIDPERLGRLDEAFAGWVSSGLKERIVTKIMRYGVPIFEGAYGDLGRDNKPLTLDTIYPVASNTKPIIAALLLIMQEDGLIDLTEPVSLHLGEFMGEGRDKIAPWHFLTHTSGVDDGDFHQFIKEYIKEKLDVEMRDDMGEDEWTAVMKKVHALLELPATGSDGEDAHAAYDALRKKTPLKREPRKHMFYCNFGYQMCRELITKLSGMSIDAYASEKLFKPLGMNDTHFILPEEKWNRVVGRSEKAWGYPWQTTPDCFRSESGSGGMKTTVIDILKFAEMIRCDGMCGGKRVMSPLSVREMKTNQNGDLPSVWDSWTMGFNYRGTKKDDAGNLRSANALDHGGYGGSKFYIDPDFGFSYAVYAVDVVGRGEANIYGRVTNMLYSAING